MYVIMCPLSVIATPSSPLCFVVYHMLLSVHVAVFGCIRTSRVDPQAWLPVFGTDALPLCAKVFLFSVRKHHEMATKGRGLAGSSLMIWRTVLLWIELGSASGSLAPYGLGSFVKMWLRRPSGSRV